MTIRKAEASDAEAIRAVILEAVESNRQDDLDELGWEFFYKQVEIDAIVERIGDGIHFTLCHFDDDMMTGVITMRHMERISQLFVRSDQREKGVAKRLWQEAKRLCVEEAGTKTFMVYSSSMAEPVYQSFGFYKAGDRFTRNGVTCTPMELNLDQSN